MAPFFVARKLGRYVDLFPGAGGLIIGTLRAKLRRGLLRCDRRCSDATTTLTVCPDGISGADPDIFRRHPAAPSGIGQHGRWFKSNPGAGSTAATSGRPCAFGLIVGGPPCQGFSATGVNQRSALQRRDKCCRYRTSGGDTGTQ